MAVHAPAVEEPRAEDAPAAPAPEVQPWPSPKTAWRTLWILSLVLGLSQVDRNILSLLLQSIKHDLRLTDGQMGMLIGLAFSVLYLPLSFPLSRISDRRSRKTMIAIGVAVWSLSTAACGLARSFWPMFLARMGLGAGESVNGPATYSLLGDSFPREKLPRAMAVLNVGFVAGSAFSLILGAGVIAALSHVQLNLPLLGQARSWQLVFFAVGLPGLLVAALVMTITEPARRGLGGSVVKGAVPISEVFGFLARNGRFWGCMFLSLFLSAIITYGTINFRAAFFQRTYNWSPQEYGLINGVLSLVTSPLGLLAGTWLCERWNRRHHDGNMRVAVLAHALSIPISVAGPLMPSPWLATLCLSVGTGVQMMAAPPMVAAMQSVTPSNVRAQVNSLYLLVFSGITGIIGPWFMGWLTDLQHNEAQLRYVMAGSSAVFLPVSLIILAFSLKPFGRMIEQIKGEEAAGRG